MQRCVLILTLMVAGLSPAFPGNPEIAGHADHSLNLFRSPSALSDTLSNPDPSPEAVALFRYLCDMSGKKILSGQMWAPWGVDELNYLQQVTGRLPAVRGADLITESANDNEVRNEINWWGRGGIPTIMWHWGAPGVGEGYENSKVEIDIDKCFTAGTKEYNDMWRELKLKADHLQVLRDAHVPVLWRPLHELNGNWFWWGKKGPEQFKRLWRTMYNYFVHDRGLNNLIWVLCYTGTPDPAWYPGDEYVDIAGADTYDGGQDVHAPMYNTVRDITGDDTAPVAYHECGVPPNPDQCIRQGVMWSWWMIWHTTWLTGNDKDYLKFVFNHDLVVTLDELPDIMAVYGWDKSCVPSAVNTRLRVDDGAWQDGNTVFIGTGASVTFNPVTSEQGSFEWSGCALSGTGDQRTVSTAAKCFSSVVFTNTCGAVTTRTFDVINNCMPLKLTPYMQTGTGPMIQTSRMQVNFNSDIVLAPEVTGEGAWSWSGCGTSGQGRIQTIAPAEACSAVAKFTNTCGETVSQTFTISPCTTPRISPFIQVFPGSWEARTDVTVDRGVQVTFDPQPVLGGSWEWTGCGTFGTSRVQSVTPDSSCTATVTFTNDCGSSGTLDFHITIINPDNTAVPENHDAGLTLYPDPCRDRLTVELPLPGTWTVTIYSSLGTPALVTRADAREFILDVSSLSPDLYFIALSNGKTEIRDHFMKIE